MKGKLILFFALLSFALHAQTDTTKSKPIDFTEYGHFVLSPGVLYQKQFMGELNIMFAKSIWSHDGMAAWGPRLGIETNFNPQHFIYAPKIGYELDLTLISLRGSLISYVDNTKVDLRLLPEIGLSFFSLINLNYGYSIPVLNYQSTQISHHRISLTFNLDFDSWQTLF